jgi:hypothetical protein
MYYMLPHGMCLYMYSKFTPPLRLVLGCLPPRVRLPIACATDRLLLQRLLRLLEAQLPEYATSLFGQSTGLNGMIKRFSDGEPAVNIYGVGVRLSVNWGLQWLPSSV